MKYLGLAGLVVLIGAVGVANLATGKPKTISTNDKAPDFSLTTESGNTFTLSEHLAHNNVVLFFYPKDNSPVCTAEACSFRDAYEKFKAVGAEVVGISSDSVDSHKDFAAKHHLGFTLLSDPKRSVRKLFGVPNNVGVIPGRVTFVIDKQGVVRNVFNSQLDSAKHVEESLTILEQLK